MKKIGQVRFYSDKNNKNYPSASKVTRQSLQAGTLFNNLNIVQLGIQTLPGTKFYLNHHATPVIIGATGIYELDLDGLTYMNGLQFDRASLDIINSNDAVYLIVDYVYEEG